MDIETHCELIQKDMKRALNKWMSNRKQDDEQHRRATAERRINSSVRVATNHTIKVWKEAQLFIHELKAELKRVRYGCAIPQHDKQRIRKTGQDMRSSRAKTVPKVAEVYSRPRVTAYVRSFMADRIHASNEYNKHIVYDFIREYGIWL